RRLGGELPSLELPTDRPRPPVQTYNGAKLTARLSSDVADRLAELARDEGTTLFTVLLATYFVFLHRYTGQTDLLVGSPVSGRPPRFAAMLGYFVNMLVMRADLAERPTFSAFLRQVRQTVLEALEQQHYPFPLLVEQLQRSRDASRSPLFQTCLVLLQSQRAELRAKGPLVMSQASSQVKVGELEAETLPLEQRFSWFDLSVVVEEAPGALLVNFQYNTDLFDPGTAREMLEHWRALLEAAVREPHRRVTDLPLLSPGKQRRLLTSWCAGPAESVPSYCLHQLFETQAEKTPHAVALVFGEEQLSYAELNARASQLAHYLRRLGVGPEIVVGLCVSRSLDLIVALIGIL